MRLPESEADDLRDAPGQVLGASLDDVYRRVVSRGDEARETFYKAVSGVAGEVPRWRLAAVAGVAALLLLLFAMRPSLVPVPPLESIAVIPFASEAGDENVEYLNDGMTDSLILNLSRLPRVKVISRNSVIRYKGKPFDPMEVGSTLNVQAALTGRVRLSGDDLYLVVSQILCWLKKLVGNALHLKNLQSCVHIQHKL